jgi:hypothetical protein
VTGRLGKRGKQLLDDLRKREDIAGGSRSQSVEDWLRKGLWACRKMMNFFFI